MTAEERTVPYPAGLRRGLDACASDRGVFTILALDHRQNLRREINPSDPDSVAIDQMVALKRVIVRVLGPLASGVLLDPEIGAAQCIADGSVPGHTGLLVALEATGYDGPKTARHSRLLENWSPRKARRMGASAAKLLVYYHPAASTASDQEDFIETVAAACRAEDLPLFLECLTYSTDVSVPTLTGEDRRRAVITAAARLTAIGSDVMKVEFPYDVSVRDEGLWADACAELDAASRVPWVLLSGGVDEATFARQAEIACRAGASGVLVGRSVWADATRLEETARERFLHVEGARRIRRLAEIVETYGRPWLERSPRLHGATTPDADWHRIYAET
jgi:tagatose 1,6-diphosphate aldolase